MTLTFTMSKGQTPRVQIVSSARLLQVTQNPRALAVTMPTLTGDQTGLQYDLNRTGTQFRFRTGALRLTLRQSIFMDRALSACARGVWKQHELDHVRDNKRLIGPRLEQAIRAHHDIKGVLINPLWHPRPQFGAIQRRTQAAVADVFLQLTTAAVRARDTFAEYRRVNLRILATCPPPFHHDVARGETLSFLALYYWGAARHWPSLYKTNGRVIGDDPDRIFPGQQLVITKTP